MLLTSLCDINVIYYSRLYPSYHTDLFGDAFICLLNIRYAISGYVSTGLLTNEYLFLGNLANLYAIQSIENDGNSHLSCNTAYDIFYTVENRRYTVSFVDSQLK